MKATSNSVVSVRIWKVFFRACSYGQKLSRLARKHFDESNNLFCLYGEMLSRLLGKVSRCDMIL